MKTDDQSPPHIVMAWRRFYLQGQATMDFKYQTLTQAERAELATQVRGHIVQFQNTNAVDEASDVRFVSIGCASSNRGAKDVRYYNLLWHGHAIAIEGDYSYVREASGFSLLFRVDAISIPKAAGVDANTVRDALAEAFAAYIGGMEKMAYVAKVELPATIDWI